MRFQFIKENQNQIDVKKACKLLNVSRSGYYKYISWKPSPHTIENDLIRAEIRQIFEAKGRNQIWLGDITYIPTQKRTLYLAVFLDVYSRKIAGWSMDIRMKEKLVIDAFNQSYGREHPGPGLIVHTDQGAQYTGDAFRSLIRSHKGIISNSRKGTPYDNAPMESFYRTLKRELINDVKFKNPEETKVGIFKYIQTYYNSKRMHSALGYLSPTEFEKMLTK